MRQLETGLVEGVVRILENGCNFISVRYACLKDSLR
jgi:hypothetical protein